MFENEKNISAVLDEYYTGRIQTTIQNLNKVRINAYYAKDRIEAKGVILNLIDDSLSYTKQHYHKGDTKQTIGFGDSLTLHQIDLFEAIYDHYLPKNLVGGGKIQLINPFERLEDGRYSEFKNLEKGWIEPELYDAAYLRVMEKMRQCLLSDVFITSANAITTQGEIISTDGVGNRLAGVIFGPYKVIIIVGRNKIVDSEEEGVQKIKNFTTPVNHLRHALMHSRRDEEGNILEKDSLYQLSKLPCSKKGHCYNCGAPNCSRRVTMVMRSPTGGSLRNRMHVVIINEDLGI